MSAVENPLFSTAFPMMVPILDILQECPTGLRPPFSALRPCKDSRKKFARTSSSTGAGRMLLASKIYRRRNPAQQEQHMSEPAVITPPAFTIARPQAGEYAPYYDRYISLVKDGDILNTLD